MQRDLKKVKHIAVLRLSALGDVTLMVPMVRAIQRHFQGVEMTWIIGRHVYGLLEGLSGVNFIVIDKPRSLKDYWRLRQQLRPYQFDVLLAAQASLRTNLIYPWIKAPIKIGFDACRSRDGHGWFINKRIHFQPEHLLEGFMRFATTLGVTDTTVVWDLPLEQSHWAWAKQQLSVRSGRWIAVNPMASKLERQWLLDRYATVVQKAVEQWKVNIVFTGGEAVDEQQFIRAIIAKSRVDCLNLAGKTSMKQLAALLCAVDVLVSPDTGPVHIATAMGTPVVGLYAVAPPQLSGPYRSSALVINKYPDAVRDILHCDPDTIAWGTRVHDYRAMQLITVEEVLEKLAFVFAEEVVV